MTAHHPHNNTPRANAPRDDARGLKPQGPGLTSAIAKTLLAGNATVTLAGRQRRYTLKIRAKEGRTAADRANLARMGPLWFVSYLNGPDNTRDFAYLGTIREDRDRPGAYVFRHGGAKARATANAPVAIAAGWALDRLLNDKAAPDLELYHAGTCCRCGRELTDPESIQRGLGPICAGK